MLIYKIFCCKNRCTNKFHCSKCCKSKSCNDSWPLIISIDAINSSYQNKNITRICGYYKKKKYIPNNGSVTQQTQYYYRSKFKLEGDFEIEKKNLILQYNGARNIWYISSESSQFVFAESAPYLPQNVNEALLSSNTSMSSLFSVKWNIINSNAESIQNSLQVQYFNMDEDESKIIIDDNQWSEASYVQFQNLPIIEEINVNQHPFKLISKSLTDTSYVYLFRSTEDTELELSKQGNLIKFFYEKAHLFWIETDSNRYKLISCHMLNNSVDTIKIDGSTKSYIWKQFLAVILLLLCIYQWYFDVSRFIQYLHNVKHQTAWNKYQCYCYIASNSSNIKQAFIVQAFWIPETYRAIPHLNIHMEKMGFLSFVSGIISFQILPLAFPSALTHMIPFVVIYYGWIVVGLLLVAYIFPCLWFAIVDCIYKIAERCENMNVTIKVMVKIGGLAVFYFFSLVFGTETMIRFYQGENYIDAIANTWNSRHTKYYIDDLENKLHVIWLFLCWIL